MRCILNKPTDSETHKQNLYSSNDITISLYLGILWGLIEVYLSPYLKRFRLPLTGVILTAIAITFIFTGKYFARSPGTILFMGLIAALIKFFSQPAIICYPSIAIMIEALIAELVILIFRIRFISFITAGILLLLYVSFHSIFTKGFSISQWKDIGDAPLFNRIPHILEIDISLQPWIIFSFFSVHVLTGVIAALLSWNFSKVISKRSKTN